MDILEDLVVVEVVDEHDRPVPPGVPGHKVLLTVTPVPAIGRDPGHGAKLKLVRSVPVPSS